MLTTFISDPQSIVYMLYKHEKKPYMYTLYNVNLSLS